MVNNMKDKKSNKTDNIVYMGGSEEALKNNKEAAYRPTSTSAKLLPARVSISSDTSVSMLTS